MLVLALCLVCLDVLQTTTSAYWALTTAAWRGTATTSRARSAVFHAPVRADTGSTTPPATATRSSALAEGSPTMPATASVSSLIIVARYSFKYL